MALTLKINDQPLSSRDFRHLHTPAGSVAAARVDGIAAAADDLRATAQELRDPALRSGAEPVRGPGVTLYRDSLHYIADKGHLPPASVHAGHEIRELYEMLMSTGSCGVGGYCPMVYLPNGELVPARFGAPVVERYQPWKAWADGIWVNRGQTVSLFTLTIRVCVAGEGPQQVATRCGIRRPRAINLLQEGLWHYAWLAGWVASPGALAIAAADAA
jgi:hypothetical protein